jgi:Kef-type K+ transport system membrane component KefB
MLVVVAIGFVIAAVSDMLGFSLAIGAFFAGLVFSRDPNAVKMESSFLPLYSLFSPFFFIGIGLDIDPGIMGTAFGIGGILLVMAILAKVIADGLPVTFMYGAGSGILIGVSMVPRAEIAMVIMKRGLTLGESVVPGKVYAAMVLVSAATCILSPWVVRSLLNKRTLEGERP